MGQGMRMEGMKTMEGRCWSVDFCLLEWKEARDRLADVCMGEQEF